MQRTIVQYRVRSGFEERNAELVRAVYRELDSVRPPGFRYATYRLADGRTFLHIAEQEGEHDFPLPGLPAFRAFRADLDARCESGPVIGPADEVGRFAFSDPTARSG